MIGEKPQWFPAPPVAAVVRSWLNEQEYNPRDAFAISGSNWAKSNNGVKEEAAAIPFAPINRLSQDSGVSVDVLWKLKCDRKKKYVDFDTADKLICTINPFLWHSDPDLAAAYQEYDLARLDERRPCLDAVAA